MKRRSRFREIIGHDGVKYALHQRGGFRMFILFFLPMLAFLLVVCFVEGEPLEWRK